MSALRAEHHIWCRERLAVTVTCCWCEWLDTAWPVLYEEAAFVVLAPGAERCTRDSLTLVPKTHTPVLAELSPDQMADVLAGLSKLARAVRQTCAVDDVGIETHPNRQVEGGHVHFHPVLNDSHHAILSETGQEREMDEKDFLAIGECMAESRAGYVVGGAT
jgi:hypothetical protein